MEPISFRQKSMNSMEEEKLVAAPVMRTKSHNAGEKVVSDRFIP
jgi:hypothetical protein